MFDRQLMGGAMTFGTRMAGGRRSLLRLLIGLSASAQAGYVVDLTQQGSDVVATGSGNIDLTGLASLFTIATLPAALDPAGAHINTGPTVYTVRDEYTGFTGPTSFGSGGSTLASSGTGDPVDLYGSTAVLGVAFLGVPLGYVSDTPLSDSATYEGATFASLGVTPGRYEWTWGGGADQNFTIVVEAVPESSTWAMMLLGFAGLGLAGYRARAGSSPLSES